MKQSDVDTDLIRRLAQLLEETGLSEIELGQGDWRVRVARGGGRTVTAVDGNVPPEPATGTAEAEAPAPEPSPPGAVTSPMVGTVYVASEPGAAPFVTVGATVNEGDTLFIIEAMKVMNPIRAPQAGTVARILVSNGDPVEYGEVLLILE